MKEVVLSLVASFAVAASALAAPPLPPPSPWDLAFGSAVMSDYILRGVTQSNHKGSVAAYFEPRYNINLNLQLYAGISVESISFANRATAEVDFYGGIRSTFGPVALDFGYLYYDYPGGTCFKDGVPGCSPALPNGNVIKASNTFYEFYAKGSWTVIEPLALGANFYYSPSFLNSGAKGEYLSSTAKYTFPTMANGVGFYTSGEFGRQWFGTTDAFYGIAGTAFATGVPLKSYNTWNLGVGATYQVFTIDLRYSTTNLNKGDCNAFTSDPGAGGTGNITNINPAPSIGSSWCGSVFIAKLSADLTPTSLK